MRYLRFRRNVNMVCRRSKYLRTKILAKTQIVVPDLTGETLAQATAHLVSASLALGTVTLTTGPVTAQSVAAETKVNVGTPIDITLTA